MSDWSDLIWIISSASSSQGDNCVEVAFTEDGEVLVRNSKDRTGPVTKFTAPEWDAFVTGTKNGEFDRGERLAQEHQ